jgi:hypothetical protein
MGVCIVTFVRTSQRINVDDANSVYHIKIKEKKTFDQWLEQLAVHRRYRQATSEKSDAKMISNQRQKHRLSKDAPSNYSTKYDIIEHDQ